MKVHVTAVPQQKHLGTSLLVRRFSRFSRPTFLSGIGGAAIRYHRYYGILVF
jgi:hypothetical protein